MNKTFRFCALTVGFTLLIAVVGCGGQPSGDATAQASAANVQPVDFKKQFEEAQRRAEEERQKLQALTERRRSFVAVAFHGFDDEGRVVVTMINRTGKPIDDIRGGIKAEDNEGNYLASSGYTIATPGDVFLEVDAAINHAPFMSRKPKLIEKLENNPEDVRFVFEAQQLIYADGTAESGLGS